MLHCFCNSISQCLRHLPHSFSTPSFLYIGQTNCLRTRLLQHNSGYCSQSTSPSRLRPYAVFSYICGLDNNKALQRHNESNWQTKMNNLVNNGITCPKTIATSANEILSSLDEDRFNFDRNEICLIHLFKNN